MIPATNVTYCDLKVFSKSFKLYSEYLVFLVCTSGCILNCFNIIVLSRKQMRCPTNFILLSLAVADLLVMLEYMPFSYLSSKPPDVYWPYYYSYYFAIYIILHAIFSQSFHFISCCITIILALWRYIAVKFPQNNKKWCSPRRTKWTIFLTYTLCPYICVPILLSSTVSNKDAYVDENNYIKIEGVGNNTENFTKIVLYYADYNESVFTVISYYIYGVVVKLVPCILLTVLSSLIIVELLAAKERRKKLMNPTVKDSNGVMKKKNNPRYLEKEKQALRTTKMLLAVLLLFLLVEFPQAIYGLLNHIIGDVFRKQCYEPLGDFLDLIAMMASAINFFLYCIMSQKFRDIFKEIFFLYVPGFRKSKYQWSQTVSTLVEL